MEEFIDKDKFESYVENLVEEKVDEKLKTTKQKPEKELYTRSEVVALFRTTHPTLDRWCEDGFLTKIRVGSRVFFAYDQVQKLLRGKE